MLETWGPISSAIQTGKQSHPFHLRFLGWYLRMFTQNKCIIVDHRMGLYMPCHARGSQDSSWEGVSSSTLWVLQLNSGLGAGMHILWAIWPDFILVFCFCWFLNLGQDISPFQAQTVMLEGVEGIMDANSPSSRLWCTFPKNTHLQLERQDHMISERVFEKRAKSVF